MNLLLSERAKARECELIADQYETYLPYLLYGCCLADTKYHEFSRSIGWGRTLVLKTLDVSNPYENTQDVLVLPRKWRQKIALSTKVLISTLIAISFPMRISASTFDCA